MHKPPVPPKTKMVMDQRPGLPTATPRSNGLALPSPGTQRRVKPAVAPKPCLSKLTTAVESKPPGSKSQHQTSVAQHPQTVGLHNSKNAIQQENKKPDWDYIVPICLCIQERCQCIKNKSIPRVEKDLQSLHKGKTGENKKLPSAADNCEKSTDNESRGTSANPPQKSSSSDTHLKKGLTLGKNANTDVIVSCPVVNVKPSLPHRTWSDEANGNAMPQSPPGQGLEEDDLGSQQMSKPKPVPGTPRKPNPIPAPRKPRTTGVACQEKEEVSEETVRQERRKMKVQEVNSMSDGMSSSSLSAKVPVIENKQPVFPSARNTCAPPALPPMKKPFYSVPEKAPTSAPQTPLKDVVEEDLGWDSRVYETSADKQGKEKVEKEGKDDQEAPDLNLKYCTSSSTLLTLPEFSKPPAPTVAAEENKVAKVPPQKPKRHISPMARVPKRQPSEENEGNLGDNKERQTLPSVMRELPLPPGEKTNRNLLTPGVIKTSRPSLGKARARSFSGADLMCSEGQRGDSFWKLLDLKLSVKNLRVKGGQNADPTANENEQSVDKEPEECQHFPEKLRPGRKFSCPVIGVEQSVDGDELSPRVEQDVYYEIISHYENVPDCLSIEVPKTGSPVQASFSHPTYHEMYDDEGIYEEPYQTACDRTSVSEEVPPLADGPLDDDDFMGNTSDEDYEDEFDTSSASSKGEPEQPEENMVQSGQKKSKIHHIVTEIMSSESVFVDVLKLLHVDFRDAVSKASHQSGKPVIEERLLNQILYYLPQLYELNQNLLRELKQRVAKWDENAQLADIFLKKGPFLKMYTIYICEFDKNVALLEEQCKRNPAFGAVVQEFEASPRCANLALKHYLLKPVQRIPQYQLLLTDYLKNLSEDSGDYKDTQAALALVKEVASHANDTMKQEDNFQKLIQIQCNLIGHPEIVQPGRIFLKEGALMKLSRKFMQPRMFFLCNDVLLYTTPVQSGMYKLNNMLSLAGMKVSKPSQEACQNELTIESVERSFILSASSATERDEWLEAVSTAISDYTKKKISFISGKSPEEVELRDSDAIAPLGSKAPIWIPDLWTSMCTICTCEFSLTRRRHHCRACGKVVCQSCSSNKHRLEYLKYQLARVCDQCFLVLLQQKNERPPLAAVTLGKLTFPKKPKKIPAALKEVSANTDNSSMSGYLQRSKGNKKQGKRMWFVIKDKVLYTYAASEDVVALESQPLLGLVLKEESSENLRFRLYHKNTLYYIFRADDVQTAQRWIDSFKEATVL